MSARRLVGVLLAAAVGLAVLKLWPRAAATPEDEIRALVARCVEAAERQDVAGLADALVDDFQGPSGASKQEVKQILRGQFLRSPEKIVVLTQDLQVKVDSAITATLQGTFVFARAADGVASASASRYQIDARLEKRGDDWQLVSAQWRSR